MQLSLIGASAQEQATIEVRSDKITLVPGEALVVRLYGKERVVTLYSFPGHAKVELLESFLQGLFYGTVIVKLDSSTERACEGEFVFRSLAPFNLTLAKTGASSEVTVKTYVCPANVTLRLLVYLGLEKDSRPISVNIPVRYFDADSWMMIPHAIFTSLFGITLMLDLRDMKRRKAGRWGPLDSVALALKYFFYASLVSLAVVALWTLGSHIYAFLTTDAVSLKLGGLLVSSIASSVMGLTYAVARWRGWYELIDEED